MIHASQSQTIRRILRRILKIDSGMISSFLEPDDIECILDLLQFEIDEDKTKAFYYEYMLREMMDER